MTERSGSGDDGIGASIVVPHDAPSPLPLREDEIDAGTLRRMVEATADQTGTAFLEALVENLARSLEVESAFVSEFLSGRRVRTLAHWSKGELVESSEWALSGTPCEEVIQGQLCLHPDRVARRFPDDPDLATLGIESYLGVPLVDEQGFVIGHLAVFDSRPLPPDARQLFIFRHFAARAAAEARRLRLERLLEASESRFRDLFEEAPIAYVLEDLESHFIAANRQAIELLGLEGQDISGFLGKSLVAETPENQARLAEAFEAIQSGENTRGVVLELRRHDDGEPIWVQWWSKPDPEGATTRTMLIDISELVRTRAEKARVEAQNDYLREEIKADHNFDEIIGLGPGILTVLEAVRRVAPTEATVLVTGETGTGKELIARALHANSPRAQRPLIKLNCAALPSGIVESELFGHEKGAFSGAVSARTGRFELAHGGTIFLDEVAELPLEVQAKLLRVLQEGEFERVGGCETLSVDTRVIAATHRDLREEVRAGRFREDLYYRLEVFPIHLPPLRERLEDLPALVHHLVDRLTSRVGHRPSLIPDETIEHLRGYVWPGNIRELQNVLERAMILNQGDALTISPSLLPQHEISAPPAAGSTTTPGNEADPTSQLSLQELEKRHIEQVLIRTGWVIEGPTGAAKALAIHPNTLRSRLKKLGLRRPPRHDPS